MHDVAICLAVACMIVWYQSGDIVAIVASTVAVFIAGILQIIESWDEESHREEAAIYAGYTITNALAFFAGKSWAIEECFYYGAMTILCVLISLSSLRQPLRNPFILQ